MNKIKRLLITCALFISCVTTTSCYQKVYVEKIPVEVYQKLDGEESYTEGDGTIDNPYVIDTKGKLIYLSNQTNDNKGNDLYYELQADINLEGINWNPIKRFEGHFNGNGYEISNFVIKNKYTTHKYYTNKIGLFGSNLGTIEKLGVTKFNIYMFWTLKELNVQVGGIAGENGGVIENCYAIGIIIAKSTNQKNTISENLSSINIGGITSINASYKSNQCSRFEGVINNCYSSVKDESAPFGSIDFLNDPIAGKINSCLDPWSGSYIYNYDYEKLDNCEIFYDYVVYFEFEDLNNKEFYINELKWNEEIWDLDDIEYEWYEYVDNQYPKLKRNK